MEAFISRRKRPRLSSSSTEPEATTTLETVEVDEEESTDVKLAILLSLHPHRSAEDLLELLLDCNGSVERVLGILSGNVHGQGEEPAGMQSPPARNNTKKRQTTTTTIGYQSALPFAAGGGSSSSSPPRKAGPGNNKNNSNSNSLLTKKGKTLHLYSPEDIAAHTPCSIIHNFLPATLANALLEELLPEVASYKSATFRLFDNVVQSPHTACLYVAPERDRDPNRNHTDSTSSSSSSSPTHLSEYLYNGSTLDDVRELLPVMRTVSEAVRTAVNAEIATRISTHYPGGKKLRFQCPRRWEPTAAFVNCYDGPRQCVGYHSDQLSYLGPRAVIGSLSLGVAREFRVRRIVPPSPLDGIDNDSNSNNNSNNSSNNSNSNNNPRQADIQGQISIHLPHNSLLVMHADMQEEWKHSIAPALSTDPHPVAGNKRINITYRWYRDEFSPRFTPRCRCGVPTVLKCVQRRRETRGRYMWMCQVGARATPVSTENNTPSSTTSTTGCGYFEWAEFTDDGDPIWKKDKKTQS